MINPFQKKPTTEKYKLYNVHITYEVLVNATNDIHAINRTRELRNALWDATRDYIIEFSITESAKAKKV